MLLRKKGNSSLHYYFGLDSAIFSTLKAKNSKERINTRSRMHTKSGGTEVAEFSAFASELSVNT